MIHELKTTSAFDILHTSIATYRHSSRFNPCRLGSPVLWQEDRKASRPIFDREAGFEVGISTVYYTIPIAAMVVGGSECRCYDRLGHLASDRNPFDMVVLWGHKVSS